MHVLYTYDACIIYICIHVSMYLYLFRHICMYMYYAYVYIVHFLLSNELGYYYTCGLTVDSYDTLVLRITYIFYFLLSSKHNDSYKL